MATCPRYTEPLLINEKIGDSLVTINNNFSNLKTVLCEMKNRLTRTVSIRTFFYYGSNGMNDGQTNRPSNSNIENFVNSSNQLNLPSISKINDQAYVIYQKTGYYATAAIKLTPDSITVVPPSEFTWTPPTQVVNYVAQTPDNYSVYAPTFIIWRLTARRINNVLTYRVDTGFPKYTQALTTSNPTTWTIYN